MITDYITFNRKEKQRSSSRINGILCSIRLFYLVNDYNELNWHVIARFKGKERRRMVEDRSYTREEIQLLLQHADLRMKVAILVMATSRVRVEGLVLLSLKDLQYIEQSKLYIIRVYSDDLHESYYTFCTPECTHFIDLYKDERKRKRGENLNDDSPLLRKDMDSFKDLRLKPHSITERIRRINIESGVQDSFQMKENDDLVEVRRQRHEIMTCHGFRKFFNTICIESNMKHIAKEMIMGHKKEQGLDRNYYRPTSDNLLQEYLKVVDDITINDEYRLKKENLELKEKNHETEYAIKGRLQEMEEKNELLTARLQQYEEAQKEGRIFSREFTKQLHELDKKIEETVAHLMLKKQQEKQQEREYETTSIDNLETKDQKFEQYNNTRKERMKQERALIDSMKKPQNKQ